MDLTSADVQDILQLIDSMPVRELHLTTTRFSLSLRRADDGAWTQELQVLSPPSMLPGPAGPALLPQAGPAAITAPSAPARRDDQVVCAPLMGTFYRAPRPGAPAFVDVGSQVEPETVVGIIETMKLMNSVPAGMTGTVTEILIGDAQFADQGTALMRIQQPPAEA
jgi:acetyl-CoA carboxylase biotin carboxyl carrier protein